MSSREIKFRAWDTVNRKMITSPMAIWSGEGGWVIFTSECEGMDCSNAIHPIQQYELMQYTGLKDCKGKEIYEGDILKMEDATAKVVFWGRPPEFGLDYDHNEDEWCEDWNLTDDSERMEVVGNIYETPELIVKEDKS